MDDSTSPLMDLVSSLSGPFVDLNLSNVISLRLEVISLSQSKDSDHFQSSLAHILKSSIPSKLMTIINSRPNEDDPNDQIMRFDSIWILCLLAECAAYSLSINVYSPTFDSLRHSLLPFLIQTLRSNTSIYESTRNQIIKCLGKVVKLYPAMGRAIVSLGFIFDATFYLKRMSDAKFLHLDWKKRNGLETQKDVEVNVDEIRAMKQEALPTIAMLSKTVLTFSKHAGSSFHSQNDWKELEQLLNHLLRVNDPAIRQQTLNCVLNISLHPSFRFLLTPDLISRLVRVILEANDSYKSSSDGEASAMDSVGASPSFAFIPSSFSVAHSKEDYLLLMKVGLRILTCISITCMPDAQVPNFSLYRWRHPEDRHVGVNDFTMLRDGHLEEVPSLPILLAIEDDVPRLSKLKEVGDWTVDSHVSFLTSCIRNNFNATNLITFNDRSQAAAVFPPADKFIDFLVKKLTSSSSASASSSFSSSAANGEDQIEGLHLLQLVFTHFEHKQYLEITTANRVFVRLLESNLLSAVADIFDSCCSSAAADEVDWNSQIFTESHSIMYTDVYALLLSASSPSSTMLMMSAMTLLSFMRLTRGEYNGLKPKRDAIVQLFIKTIRFCIDKSMVHTAFCDAAVTALSDFIDASNDTREDFINTHLQNTDFVSMIARWLEHCTSSFPYSPLISWCLGILEDIYAKNPVLKLELEETR